jgi:UDP-N-acetylglucosamine 2-epimerase (non-hydrolysing)
MAKITVATVFGTRPEIIKLSSYIEEMDKRIDRHFLIHANQHSEYEADIAFCKELEIRRPDFRLTAQPGNQTVQLGQMISQLAAVYDNIKPDWVVVLGDSNSSVAGAISAKKFGAKVTHIESGIRSSGSPAQDDTNGILADHISDLLLAPTKDCIRILRREGVPDNRVKLANSTLPETCRRNLEIAERKASVEVHPPFALMMILRRGNIEDKRRLKPIVTAMARVSQKTPVIFSAHPDTGTRLAEFGLSRSLGKIQIVPALSYLDYLYTLSKAELVLTDSAGVQDEARILKIPTLMIRRDKERMGPAKGTGTILVDTNENSIMRNAMRMVRSPAFKKRLSKAKSPQLESGVARKIVSSILRPRTEDRLRER